MTLDFRNPLTALAPFTRAQIEASFPALPEGWTAADDLTLWEGLFKGLGLGRIAALMGRTLTETSGRFLALKGAAVGTGTLTLPAQKEILAVIQERHRKAQEAANGTE